MAKSNGAKAPRRRSSSRPQSGRGGTAIALPHDRDERADPRAPAERPEIAQAAADIERGLVDTDRRQDAVNVFRNSGSSATRLRWRPRRRP